MSLTHFPQLLKSEFYFPRRITQLELKVIPAKTHWLKESVLLILDFNKTAEVISYWNVRAMGRDIFPVPKQLLEVDEVRNHARDFLKRANKPLPYREDLFERGRLMRSPSVDIDLVKNFAQSLSIGESEVASNASGYFSADFWFPLTNENIATEDAGSQSDSVYSDEKQISFERDLEFQRGKTIVHFLPVYPKFLNWQPLPGHPHFINEVNLSVVGSNGQFAQAFPRSNGRRIKQAVCGFTMFPDDDWRIGRSGPIKFLREDREVRWELPSSQNMFFAWLADHGWQAESSTPGIIGREMAEQLNGGINALANEEVLRLLEKMCNGPNGERELAVGEVRNRLKKIRGDDRLYEYLISLNVFQVGPKIQCPHCTKNTWYDLDSVKEQLKCPRCLKVFPAVGRINKGKWAYRTAGPFSVSGYADGAYCVLLAVDFFSEGRFMTSIETTPVLSFCAKDQQGKVIEADFGVLWREKWAARAAEGVIFGECKTFGEFDRDDFAKMEMLARSFPGAILAFCTLRESLHEKELKQLRRLAKIGRKKIKDGKPLNPVVIMTANELFGYRISRPKSWMDAGIDKSVGMISDLYELCDLTQQIYLGLTPWREELTQRYEKKQKTVQ